MEAIKPPRTIGKFIYYFIIIHKYSILILFLCASLSGVCGTVNSYFTKTILDIIDNPDNNSHIMSLASLPSIFLIISLEAHNCLWRIINYINLKTAPAIKNKIIETLFNYTHSHSHRFFQENFTGTVSGNITRVAEHVEIILNDCSPFIVRSFVQTIVALAGMYLIHPTLSVALFIWIILFMILSVALLEKVTTLSDSYAKSQAELDGRVGDSIYNASSVRLFAQFNFETKYLAPFLDNTLKKYQAKEWFSIKFWFFQGFSISILIGFMLFTLIFLRTQEKVTVGDFAFVLGLTLYVTENIWSLAEYVDKISNSIGQCKQSLNAILMPIEIPYNLGAPKLVIDKAIINFNKVSFYYIKNKYIFDSLSLVIESKQKVGIVGLSGSGKTTFINLILRSFEVNSGNILIDQQDVSLVDLNSLQKSIGFVPQDSPLFHRSIIDNIRYGKLEATSAEVIEAARLAHAHEFISKMPEGYDSLVGEGGVKLSGGQRQRISIARAILKNAPILIMDEATSALDSLTEKYIQDSLKNLMGDKTVIVIAHRLSTLLSLDRILVFDGGGIIEDGSHKDLLNNGGLYKNLWEKQSNGYLL